MQHVTIYREQGRFAGWPANYGLWAWGDEIVVGFTVGHFDATAGFHAKDRNQPFTTLQARSLDGGQSWQVSEMPCHAPGHRALSADEHVCEDLRVAGALTSDPPLPCPGDVPFTHPDFAMMCARTGLQAGAVSWFYVSTDRCHTWQGPYALPDFGLPGTAARTDTIILAERSLLLMLTAAKDDGREGRVFCARTDNGGRSFRFVSWVTPEPEGYTIMPSTVQLPSGRLLCAVRCASPKTPSGNSDCWIDLYASDDLGKQWQLLQTLAHTGMHGNPPAMIRLRDGRICLTYGYRLPPFGIRARMSADEGATWGDEIVLRDDGGHPDLGYPRSAQRADGTILTAYYFNDDAEGERYIAATLWKETKNL